MKLKTISELQYKSISNASSVSSSVGKYNRGSVNDLSKKKKRKKKPKTKEN